MWTRNSEPYVSFDRRRLAIGILWRRLLAATNLQWLRKQLAVESMEIPSGSIVSYLSVSRIEWGALPIRSLYYTEIRQAIGQIAPSPSNNDVTQRIRTKMKSTGEKVQSTWLVPGQVSSLIASCLSRRDQNWSQSFRTLFRCYRISYRMRNCLFFHQLFIHEGPNSTTFENEQ